MTAEELQTYIDQHIPIVRANGFTVLEAGDTVSIGARLAEHVNHRASAFGGSLSTALILAAWARVRLWTDTFAPRTVIVIAEQNVRFTAPVLADFAAVSRPVDAAVWTGARDRLERFGKARFTVGADIVHQGGDAVKASFEGLFVLSLKSG